MTSRRALTCAVSAALALTATGCWDFLGLGDKQFTRDEVDHTGMIKVVMNDVEYYIDATEVTYADYTAWLATNPSLGDQDMRCTWNESFTPGEYSSACMERHADELDDHCPNDISIDEADPRHPVRCVDWCDALAYCRAHGKRFCGHSGGGPLEMNDSANIAVSEWYFACTGGDSSNVYPYGPTAKPNTCIDSLGPSPAPDVGDVGTSTCEGGFPGLFDMSGNVEEWTDDCDGAGSAEDGSDDGCWRTGGAYWNTDDENAPTCAHVLRMTRSCLGNTTGFRCCADP